MTPEPKAPASDLDAAVEVATRLLAQKTFRDDELAFAIDGERVTFGDLRLILSALSSQSQAAEGMAKALELARPYVRDLPIVGDDDSQPSTPPFPTTAPLETAMSIDLEPVAWRVRRLSDDPEEWQLRPAGAALDFGNPDRWQVQGLVLKSVADAAARERDGLREALTVLLAACEKDFGVPDENDGDDEAVGASTDGDCAVTFGMMRRARQALASRAGGEGA